MSEGSFIETLFNSRVANARRKVDEALGEGNTYNLCDADSTGADQPVEYTQKELQEIQTRNAKSRIKAQHIAENNRPKRPRPSGGAVGSGS